MQTISKTLILLAAGIMMLGYGAGVQAEDENWDPVFNFQLKLAQQGNVKAQYILGEMYEQGRGVEKNYDTAIQWYQKAQQNGHQKAALRIANIKETIRQEALEKVRAEAERKRREAEKARQIALQKQREEEERRRQEALARAQAKEEAEAEAAKQASQQAQQQQESQEDNLTPEERAQKIKEAQQRAQEIAKQNALRQQKQAEAQLEKYRASLNAEKATKAKSNVPKLQDPFE